MGLVAFTPWVCLRCGARSRGLFAPDCCDDKFAIQVRIDVPGHDDPPAGVMRDPEEALAS